MNTYPFGPHTITMPAPGDRKGVIFLNVRAGVTYEHALYDSRPPLELLRKRLKRDHLTDAPISVAVRAYWGTDYALIGYAVPTGQQSPEGKPFYAFFTTRRDGRIGRAWSDETLKDGVFGLLPEEPVA